MDRGARSWVTNVSQRIDPMLLQGIFQTPFYYYNYNNSDNHHHHHHHQKKRKTYRPVARQKHTLTQTGST